MAYISNIVQGKYFLNNKDMFLEYGFVSDANNSNIDDLISEFPDKERYSHDWQDENGVEFDDAYAPLKGDKQFTLNGYIAASSFADWNEKYEKLRTDFNVPGTIPFEYRPFGIKYNVRKQGQIKPKQIEYLGNTFFSRIEIPLIAVYSFQFLPPATSVVYGEGLVPYYEIIDGEMVFITN